MWSARSGVHPGYAGADPRGRTTLTSTSGGRHLPVARGEETADTCLSVGDPADVAAIENAYALWGLRGLVGTVTPTVAK